MRGTSPIVRLVLVLALGLTWAANLTPQPANAATETAPSAYHVYTNTGTWAYGGRTWVTNCTKYSTTVDRCETKIWAMVTEYTDGKFVTAAKWAFNNLTYKPSPRANWSEFNVLVTPGEQTINGRRWKTECDTSWTGSNACRTQIWATVPEQRNGVWTNVNKWVFNNIAHVTPVTCPVSQATVRKDVGDAGTVSSNCLQSKNDPTWAVVDYPARDSDGQLYNGVVLYKKSGSTWAYAAHSIDASSFCDYQQKAGVPIDLYDNFKYCFPVNG